MGQVDEFAAEQGFVAVSAVRALRLVLPLWVPLPPPRDRPQGRWGMLSPWFRKEP